MTRTEPDRRILSRRLDGAFTLVEMLIVVIIVSILATLLIVAVAKARAKARQVKCMGNLGALGKNMISHATQRNGGAMVDFDCDGGGWDIEDGWYVEILAFMRGIERSQIRLDSDPDRQSIVSESETFHCPSDKMYFFSRDDLSYGLNCDVRYDNGTAYTFDGLEATAADDDDREYDTYTLADIVKPGQFILLADTAPMSGGSSDVTNREYRSWIASRKTGNYDNTRPNGDAGRRPISAPHNGEANILYADGHVESQDFSMYSPARDNRPTSDQDWFRLWSLGNQ